MEMGRDYFIVLWGGRWDGDFLQRVVYFAWLAVDFLDGDCGWHGCGCDGATYTMWRWRGSESHDTICESLYKVEIGSVIVKKGWHWRVFYMQLISCRHNRCEVSLRRNDETDADRGSSGEWVAAGKRMTGMWSYLISTSTTYDIRSIHKHTYC